MKILWNITFYMIHLQTQLGVLKNDLTYKLDER